MAEEKVSGSSIRFGPFELSLETHELSRDGIRLKLHGQPIQVLELLLACPGRMVTREELKRKLWPQETFGDFERGLNAAVNRLRDKLCDSAVEPIYVETVPSRGYRFIGKLESPTPVPPTPQQDLPSPLPDPHPPVWRRRVAITLVMVVVGAVAYWWFWWRPYHYIRIPNPVWVLITDFESGGDDPLPDSMIRMVREGLTIDLQQSQYVNVFSRSQIQEILMRMEKQPETRIDEGTGREICRRSNLPSLVLSGSAVKVNEVFEIAVHAVDPDKGTLYFTRKSKYFKANEFFPTIDALAKNVREQVGESAKGIQSSNRPLAEVTTPSLEALQLYSEAADAMDQVRVGQALALLLSALARDPNFAMAHHLIAQVYEMMGNRAEQLEHIEHAYHLRARLTDRESSFVTASYYQAKGDPDNAVSVLTTRVDKSSLDWEARRRLASAYYDLGELDNSILQLKEVIKIDPNSALSYADLVVWLTRNNVPDEAIQMYKTAQARDLVSPRARWGLGMALWNQGKVDEAQAEFQRLQEQTPNSVYSTIGRIYLERTLIYQGKLTQASTQLAVGVHLDQIARNKAAELLERYLLAAIAVTEGNGTQARLQLQVILSPDEAPALQATDLRRAGALYVQMRDVVSARRILRRLEDLLHDLPSPFNSACRDNLEGEIALAEARNIDAEQLFITSLETYPLAPSHYGLALAYEAQHDWPSAAEEWERFLDARGQVFQDYWPADWVLAHQSLAQVDLHLHEIKGSRAEYKKLLEIWRDGDRLGFVQQVVRQAQQAAN